MRTTHIKNRKSRHKVIVTVKKETGQSSCADWMYKTEDSFFFSFKYMFNNPNINFIFYRFIDCIEE